MKEAEMKLVARRKGQCTQCAPNILQTDLTPVAWNHCAISYYGQWKCIMMKIVNFLDIICTDTVLSLFIAQANGRLH